MQPMLIAHRGYPRRYPENTITGMQAALDQGARWLETDIQLSRDEHPFLYHDASLERVSGCSGDVADCLAGDLCRLPASEPGRWGDRFHAETIAPLERLVQLLAISAEVQVFLELKPQSLQRVGSERMIDAVARVIEPVAAQCVWISFDLDALAVVRRRGDRSTCRIGWVLPEWTELQRQRLEETKPEFAFVNSTQLPTAAVCPWPGVWHWAIYVIDDAAEALRQPARGIHWVETNAIGEVLTDERWIQHAGQ